MRCARELPVVCGLARLGQFGAGNLTPLPVHVPTPPLQLIAQEAVSSIQYTIVFILQAATEPLYRYNQYNNTRYQTY